MTGHRALLLALASALALVGLVPAAGATRGGCAVKNLTQGTSYESGDGSALHEAISAAAPDDDLRARGTCVGTFVVDQDLRLHGSQRIGSVVLDADARGTTLTVRSGATVGLQRIYLVDGSDSALVVEAGASVRLSDAQVHVSTSPTNGGLIRNHGALAVRDSSLGHGAALGHGGAIYNDGTLRASRVELAFNVANANGGGLANLGTATVRGSLIRRNSATGTGGGIFNPYDLQLIGTVFRSNEPNDCSGC